MVLDRPLAAGAPMATAWTWTWTWAKMGGMNRDDKPASMDALMILQAAADTVQYCFVFSGDFMT